ACCASSRVGMSPIWTSRYGLYSRLQPQLKSEGGSHVGLNYSRKLRYRTGTTILLSVCLAIPALAQQSGGPTTQTSDRFLDFFRRTEMSGFVDVYYGYNFNTPGTRKAGPERTFDVNHNSLSLNLAELSVEKKPTTDSRGGFRLDLDYGPTQDIVNATDP